MTIKKQQQTIQQLHTCHLGSVNVVRAFREFRGSKNLTQERCGLVIPWL